MQNYINLNAAVFDDLENDKKAAHAYFLEHVNRNTVFFHTLREKVDYMIENGHWNENIIHKVSFDELKSLFQFAYSFKFRFKTYMGAVKFYNQYAIKTPDGQRYLERYEDRVVMNALAYGGRKGKDMRRETIEAIISGAFQPATPSFINAGRADGGQPVSCFLIRAEDSMASIGNVIKESLMLSKNGGGVSILLSNVREKGAPIQNVEGVARGVVPIMKLLEDSFSYADQLGQRQGAGAAYLSVHHMDIEDFLDTKKENADEKVRIKTLSIGVCISDVFMEKLKEKDPDKRKVALFSAYDVSREYGKTFGDLNVSEIYNDLVDNQNIKKRWVDPRDIITTIARLQFESGYPYIMFEDTVNRANTLPSTGRITHSNLCSEILQPSAPALFDEKSGELVKPGIDIACNLGSLNIARALDFGLEKSVKVAYEYLNQVALQSNLTMAKGVSNGNHTHRAIGLGQMNLHGWLLEQGVAYDSQEARDMFRDYMAKVTALLLEASSDYSYITERFNLAFPGFSESEWTRDEVWYRLAQADVNNVVNWIALRAKVQKQGLANSHLQAIPPTGSISYINHATASIHPITSAIEARKESTVGRVYYPQPGVTRIDEKNAYDYDQKAIIDMYAEVTPFVDQGMSLTLFYSDETPMKEVVRNIMYAHSKGIKTLYYVRVTQKEVVECQSCSL